MSELSEVKGHIQNIVTQLTAVRYQMLGVQASVPPGAAETSQEDCDADPDTATEIRVVVGNCINDSLDPLIRYLGDLVTYEPATPTPSGEAAQGEAGQG